MSAGTDNVKCWDTQTLLDGKKFYALAGSGNAKTL